MKARQSSDWTQANLSTWDERAGIYGRDATGFYGLERLRAGEDLLTPIEVAEIGDIRGKHLVHLQCHLGIDTLCLARRGAAATGLDFSGTAVASATALAAETGLNASFVQSDVYEAAKALAPRRFDIVYVNWGSLNWLPDLERWAVVVAQLLEPGGHLYLIEQHPFLSAMKERHGRMEVGYAWRTPPDRPLMTDTPTTYSGDPTPLVHRRLHEWDHPLSDIIGSLLAAGLRLEFFHEHDVLPWPRVSMMVPIGGRLYRLTDDQVAMPLSFSLKAAKPA